MILIPILQSACRRYGSGRSLFILLWTHFFAKDSADLAVLVSPVHFHTDMVLSCLEHGVNVLCEKPLCLTVKEAAAMQEASKKTGKFLCIGYQLNYRRDVQALKRDILLGRFGKAKHIAVYHGFRRGAAYSMHATIGPGGSPARGGKYSTVPLQTRVPIIFRC